MINFIVCEWASSRVSPVLIVYWVSRNKHLGVDRISVKGLPPGARRGHIVCVVCPVVVGSCSDPRDDVMVTWYKWRTCRRSSGAGRESGRLSCYTCTI